MAKKDQTAKPAPAPEPQGSPELQRELEHYKAEAANYKAAADEAHASARRAAVELAAAQDELAKVRRLVPAGVSSDPYANDRSARNFLYVKGDPKNPASPRVRVRALTQAQADERAAPQLKDGYAFRGCQA